MEEAARMAGRALVAGEKTEMRSECWRQGRRLRAWSVQDFGFYSEGDGEPLEGFEQESNTI